MKITFDNGEVYTEEEFHKDYTRMMDSLREINENIEKNNCADVNCNRCPLHEKVCGAYDELSQRYNSTKTIKIVHDWAKNHPVMTNREKLKEVFNVNLDKDAELYLSYYAGQRIKFDLTAEDRWINQPINKWLDSEYKGTKKNDSSNY